MLRENGGVLLKDNHVLVENFDWLDHIDANPYVNRIDRSMPTEVIGFYDPDLSSVRERRETPEPVNAPFKMIRPIPGILPTFLAAKKDSRFLN